MYILINKINMINFICRDTGNLSDKDKALRLGIIQDYIEYIQTYYIKGRKFKFMWYSFNSFGIKSTCILLTSYTRLKKLKKSYEGFSTEDLSISHTTSQYWTFNGNMYNQLHPTKYNDFFIEENRIIIGDKVYRMKG